MPLPLLPPVASEMPEKEAPALPSLGLQTYSYDERREVLPAVTRTLEACGCWVLERKTNSATQMELRFEMQLRAALELYSSLIGAGLEMTRASHLALTSLCTVRKHRRRQAEAMRVVEVRLEISFLEELNLASVLAPGAGLA